METQFNRNFKIGELDITREAKDVFEKIAEQIKKKENPNLLACEVKLLSKLILDEECQKMLKRHLQGDWGEADKAQKEHNDKAILFEGDTKRQDSVLSIYTIKGITFHVHTDYDRTKTTIFLPRE